MMMDEKQALEYAANILRTLGAQMEIATKQRDSMFRAARVLDDYFQDEEEGDGQ